MSWINYEALKEKLETLSDETGLSLREIARRVGRVQDARSAATLKNRFDDANKLRPAEHDALLAMFGLAAVEREFLEGELDVFKEALSRTRSSNGLLGGSWRETSAEARDDDAPREDANEGSSQPKGERRPDLAGIGLEEGQGGPGEPRPILIEVACGDTVELIEGHENGEPDRRVALELTRLALRFEFAPETDPAMQAKFGSRLGRESGGHEIAPGVTIYMRGDADRPIWIVETDGARPLASFATTEAPLFLLENGPDGGIVRVWVQICAKDCALIPKAMAEPVNEESLTMAQQRILTILEVKKIFGGGRFERVVNEKALKLRDYSTKEPTR